jgi:hypothetical protein
MKCQITQIATNHDRIEKILKMIDCYYDSFSKEQNEEVIKGIIEELEKTGKSSIRIETTLYAGNHLNDFPTISKYYEFNNGDYFVKMFDNEIQIIEKDKFKIEEIATKFLDASIDKQLNNAKYE